ncbi:MAG: gliding motility protein GldL, partial [Bacteroidales bacterium]|nr:gliding motility protein GldL [Bacteroidales bacterium]
TKSRGFKNFMAKLYGIGAAVVIIGALFKITHIPGADAMLFVGLTTEAVIFFFSAFEPPHVEPDWSLVYPELAGMYHGMDSMDDDFPEFMEDELDDEEDLSVTQQLDGLLAEAKIDGALIESLGLGLKNLSQTAGQMNQMAEAAEVNTVFVDKVKSASETVSTLTTTYQKANDALGQDIEVTSEYHNSLKGASVAAASLSSAYSRASEAMNNDLESTGEFSSKVQEAAQSASMLAQEYQKSIEMMRKSAEALNFTAIDGGNYNEELQKISSNLSALNAVYELQLQSSSEQVESSAKVQDSMNQFLENLNLSIETTRQYQTGVNSLTKNVEALNKVYGNMLSAMTFNPQA